MELIIRFANDNDVTTFTFRGKIVGEINRFGKDAYMVSSYKSLGVKQSYKTALAEIKNCIREDLHYYGLDVKFEKVNNYEDLHCNSL